MGSVVSRIFVLTFIFAVSCTPGTLDDDCRGTSCSDSGVDADADTDVDTDINTDPCENIICGEGQVCTNGRCLTPDRCTDVVCPNEDEVCDPRDGMCHVGTTDDDRDGSNLGDGDCDDSDPLVFPGAEERCDGVDNDCDREVDESFPDSDNDGYDTCGFGNASQADCDDDNPSRYPFAIESCDGLDNDCNEEIDEELASRACTTTCGTGEERCEGGRWVCSVPEVCECSPAGAVENDQCGNCGSRSRSCGDDLSWSTWSECVGEGECGPGSFSNQDCGLCGTQERTCAAGCSWNPWGECTAEGECTPDAIGSCTTTCGSSGTQSCDALCTWSDCSPPEESCNGTDDDCDGDCDEGCRHGVHRAYNGTDHFYTTSEADASCCGYTLEFLNYFYLSTTAVAGTTELYNCWRETMTDHFYTTSATCEGSGATLLGSIGFIATAETCGATPLYRLRNSAIGDHFYTTSASERDNAVDMGWIFESIAGYVWTEP